MKGTERIGKGEEKEKKKERERKGRVKGKISSVSVSHGPFLMPKVIVFVLDLLSFVNPVCVFLFLLAIIEKGV